MIDLVSRLDLLIYLYLSPLSAQGVAEISLMDLLIHLYL